MNDEYQKDLASIRSMMERSVKFMSLSGLSGVLAGGYALVGAYLAYLIMYYPSAPVGYEKLSIANHPSQITRLAFIAFVILAASLVTGFFLSWLKAKRIRQSLWNETSRLLLVDLIITLGTGGLFVLILFIRGYYSLLAPCLLIFYGLALIHCSRHTFAEIKYLGFIEIMLGLISSFYPEYGLVTWTIGFGLMHIIYGAVMYFRHER
ncbi:MAG: hypothetical protein OJF59_000154 [Cytophagales bacterium]|jgi:predicted lysophospholipase L1 biosynthesis ABC-type transport system permease subunit|nr:hypothetical protein [Bacteroidota bacterium]MBS1982125.1 hypothetical protein [Bacteroidota bacterium]WHZ06401.1 MAG: hypothetical protein OJF59_000154 [Cytophagales bacterium]